MSSFTQGPLGSFIPFDSPQSVVDFGFNYTLSTLTFAPGVYSNILRLTNTGGQSVTFLNPGTISPGRTIVILNQGTSGVTLTHTATPAAYTMFFKSSADTLLMPNQTVSLLQGESGEWYEV